THPGAIVLLHPNSSTNTEILDEVLTHWEKEGYKLKTLDYLNNKK
ncbi:delta-lactam-biosynthetic de-N-acetylase, partial [Clostridioides difficile]